MIRENFNDNWSIVKDTGNMAAAAFMGKAEEKRYIFRMMR